MTESDAIDAFIEHWGATGGSELANTQSFINGLCGLIGVAAPNGSHSDDARNDYVFERRVFQDNGDGTESFGRIDAYKRDSFVLEAKQGSEGDRVRAAEGQADYDLFGQSATLRVKRGTARRGTPGWTTAMVQAKGQAERYAKALPADHGWPPFLLVTDVGYCIEVFADFTGTGKAYAQFPDRASFRVMLDDLRDPDVRSRLAKIWDAPASLDPAAITAKATREIAAQLAELSKSLELRGHDPEQVSTFLMRCLFTMFAENVRLLPENSFKELLQRLHQRPENLVPQLSDLWVKMNSGGFVGALGGAGESVRKFNGYLFRDATAIELTSSEIGLLIAAAAKDWREVEPAIFGTLLERALNPAERARLGAHYTPRAYVERLVMPTVIEPLRGDWNGVRGAATQLIDSEKTDEALRLVKAFHARLAGIRVLDPACGTGNFLYVAMARMKEIEGEVVELLTELGDDQYVAELSGHTITPENFLGIEINPRAAAIAQLVLWIGYLQWHFRVAGNDRMPPEPILKDIRTIECRDALMEWDKKILVRDARGEPMTRWDGETKKQHLVTGKLVPDDTARVEVWRYVSPRAARWPKADFIVGNPPFIGKGARAREYLGRPYLDALKTTTRVKLSADYVMHWWDKAARLVAAGSVRRFGFITSNTITQIFNAKVVKLSFNARQPFSLLFAIADHPWVDEKGSAAVRISMTVGEKSRVEGSVLQVIDETNAPDILTFTERKGIIKPTLVIDDDAKSASPLKANGALASPGIKTFGSGFIMKASDAAAMKPSLNADEVRRLKPYFGGKDITERWHGHFAIDVDDLEEEQLAAETPTFYNRLYNYVKPERDLNDDVDRRTEWWKFGRRNTEMRTAISGLSRFIVTTETSKHRIFQFLPAGSFPEGGLVTIGSDDAFHLAVLSSRVHSVWVSRSKGVLESRPRYNKTRCFDPYPFPADVAHSLLEQIRAEGEKLDALRKRVLSENSDLTMTQLYNVVEKLSEGGTLTPPERDVHDRGLVTLLRQHHAAVDDLVVQAYGWPSGIEDGAILTRLVSLNRHRADEEAKGVIRWLRPAFQAPATAASRAERFDLGEVATPESASILPWPTTLPEQVTAVARVLGEALRPMNAREVASAFAARRSPTVKPVLDALAAIGMARRLADGRYAA